LHSPFYKRFYAPNNATLVIAGDITIDEIRPLAEKDIRTGCRAAGDSGEARSPAGA